LGLSNVTRPPSEYAKQTIRKIFLPGEKNSKTERFLLMRRILVATRLFILWEARTKVRPPLASFYQKLAERPFLAIQKINI